MQLNNLEKPIIILGIGNTLKGDDGLGPKLIEALRTADPDNIQNYIDAGIVPENYIGKIIKLKAKTIILIDALSFNGNPGEIKQLKPAALSGAGFSTHSLSPDLFLSLISKELNPNVIIIGIQPEQVALGEGLSSAIQSSLAILQEEILKCMR